MSKNPFEDSSMDEGIDFNKKKAKPKQKYTEEEINKVLNSIPNKRKKKVRKPRTAKAKPKLVINQTSEVNIPKKTKKKKPQLSISGEVNFSRKNSRQSSQISSEDETLSPLVPPPKKSFKEKAIKLKQKVKPHRKTVKKITKQKANKKKENKKIIKDVIKKAQKRKKVKLGLYLSKYDRMIEDKLLKIERDLKINAVCVEKLCSATIVVSHKLIIILAYNSIFNVLLKIIFYLFQISIKIECLQKICVVCKNDYQLRSTSPHSPDRFHKIIQDVCEKFSFIVSFCSNYYIPQEKQKGQIGIIFIEVIDPQFTIIVVSEIKKKKHFLVNQSTFSEFQTKLHPK